MSHIDLDTQGETIKQFFLSLPVDPEGTLVKVKGRAVARLVPIAADNGHSGKDSGWTKEKNHRRSFLIDRDIDGTMTPEEAHELEGLQRQLDAHLQRVAPLRLDATRRLHAELLAKAEAARKQ